MGRTVYFPAMVLMLIVYCANFIDMPFCKAKYIFIRTTMVVDKNISVLEEIKEIKNKELEETKEIYLSSKADKDARILGQAIIKRLNDEMGFLKNIMALTESRKDAILIIENLWLGGYYSEAEKEKVYLSAVKDLNELKRQLSQLKEYKKQIHP